VTKALAAAKIDQPVAAVTHIMRNLLTAAALPRDRERALLVGRVWMPQVQGPVLVQVRGDDIIDLSAVAPTCSHLLERNDCVAAILRTTQSIVPRRGF
jgi:fumarylacetoacetate (FAA) hydrolase family protein